jgi:hypothetical protein
VAQDAQADRPEVAVNRPAEQPVHTPAAAAEYAPAAQPAQLVEAAPPAVGRYEPAGQPVQAVEPVAKAKYPAVQLVHTEAAAPAYEPGAQAVQTELPEELYEPAPQFAHSVDAELAWKVPAEQLAQLDDEGDPVVAT